MDLDALDGPTGLIARRRRFLVDYQDESLARRYEALLQRVRAAEEALGGQAASRLDLTRAVARQYARLLAVKDEYEVVRLHLDPAFEAALRQQFGRWDRVVHHLAPPLLSRPGPDGRPRKRPFGPWVRVAIRVLARMKGLRGTPLDPATTRPWSPNSCCPP
jgi:indolepyruvate ferredoxin oxidoreductase